MIRHIVLFRLAGTEAARAEAYDTLAGVLRPLADTVPGVISLRVDIDDTGIAAHWDAALVSEHASWDDLTAYQAHPAHRAALEIVNTVITDRAVADYEI